MVYDSEWTEREFRDVLWAHTFRRGVMGHVISLRDHHHSIPGPGHVLIIQCKKNVLLSIFIFHILKSRYISLRSKFTY